ncbi:NAD(P)H-dependent oxidoreductase [Pseudoalteromonas sp. T1lg24]|uniref:NAD(P)H-dependent oxidoreductase n=1 Tax=Pseudoalteromonas sp. T1lg24 TaxID=2077099 RepID=UPI000CF6CDDF|nr:NAD(P)H-dependent oxidoreductase [Pseudoalteromonas sp. T1lg24]
MSYLLVLYHSRTDSVKNMAYEISDAAQHAGIDVKIRCFSDDSDDLVVTIDELKNCAGLAFGSPTRFGMMASPAKQFWETTSDLWLAGQLIDKPAAVFTSSSSQHGGNESTLLSMALPLLHHGMLLCGVPYDVPALSATQTGGTPYGASHVSGLTNSSNLSQDEIAICQSVGNRLAKLIKQLQ